MGAGNNYQEMHPHSCASFAINADTLSNTVSLMFVEQFEPSSNYVEAITNFIRLGADISNIVFTGMRKLIEESANILPMVHLCETIEDCHSVAKIHILSSTSILLQNYDIYSYL